MIYVYAIAEAPAEPPPGLRAVERGGLAAVVGGEVLEPDADAFLAHEEVVEALMAERPVLPARFGTTFSTEAELEAVLEERAASFRELLAKVDGCVELSVRPPLEAGDRVLSGLARASRRAGGTAAYLVRADDVPAFAARVREIQHEHEDLDLSCTGPWPPYSFVS